MQKAKRNHWVPQAYLRAFETEPERRDKIWRFGKSGGNPELKPIENVALKFHLYAPKGSDGTRDYGFEKKLANLESLFGHPLWGYLCTDMIDLTREPIRRMVSLLIAVMYARNPAQFEFWKYMHGRLVEFFSNRPDLPRSLDFEGQTYKIDAASWPSYRDASEDDLKREWLEQVGNTMWLADLLMKMRWAVVVSEEPLFVTSDNPVSVLHPSMRFRGFNNPETSVVFPLSPTRYLHLDNRHDEPDGHYYPLKQPAANVNLLLWRSANEYLFAHRDPDAICAELVTEGERAGYL